MANKIKTSEQFFEESITLLTPESVLIGSSSSSIADIELKTGDKVYMTVNFKGNSFVVAKADDGTDIKIDTTTPSETLLDSFASNFEYRIEATGKVLSVIAVSATLTATPAPTGTTKTAVATTSVFEMAIKYLLDTSDLDTGENIVTVWTVDSNELLFTSDTPFYLHQSFKENLQRNFNNSSIASEAKGLEREKLNYPSYLPVGLQPVNPLATKDTALWEVIQNGTDALSFKNYSAFMDFIFCGGPNPFSGDVDATYKAEVVTKNQRLALPFTNVEAYRVLKVATEAFVMATINVSGNLDANLSPNYNKYLETVKTGVTNPATVKILPYLALVRNKLPDLDLKFGNFEDGLSAYINNNPLMESCYGLINSKLQFPCFIELIWSYWMEESMMVQGITSVAKRFQNIRSGTGVDPLANLEIGPLRTLNNLLWGYVQDEQHRLTVRRRTYEYDHHYGISLQGNGLLGLRMADSRSKFIEAFHTLLNLCVKFYYQYDDTTVVADAFPIMNALKEVHMILSEGAHNQYGDLPSTARIEMLMQQYILARPEFREFLPSRQMVVYPEPWMDRVAVLNQVHNWTNTSVMHFRDLAIFGEQIILSIRFGNWTDVFNRDQAANWAIFWRPQISNYIHSYRAATGVDLSKDGTIDAQQPSAHLVKRLRDQNSKVRV